MADSYLSFALGVGRVHVPRNRARRPAAAADRVALWCAVVFIVICVWGALDAARAVAVRPASQSTEGVAAPAETVRALQAGLNAAVQRFEAKDVAGVLAHVSDQYRTGPFTKAVLREHLIAMFSIYDSVQARVVIDDVRIVDKHGWVYSTGEVSGRLRLVGSRVVILSWQRELEVARREAGGWRLFGYQQ